MVAVGVSGCQTVQLESRLASSGLGQVGNVYIQGPASTTITEQTFEETLQNNLTQQGYKITNSKKAARYVMVYDVEHIITPVGGSYVLPSHQTTTGYIGQDRVSLRTRENQVHSWSIDIPETIVRAQFKNKSNKILWEGGMLIRQEAFAEKSKLLADRFMSAFGKEVNYTKSLN